MKKLFILLCALSLTTTMLAGCATDSSADTTSNPADTVDETVVTESGTAETPDLSET